MKYVQSEQRTSETMRLKGVIVFQWVIIISLTLYLISL